MSLNESLYERQAIGAMQLPAGVVANAPYQGSAPMFPNIAVPLGSSYSSPRSRYEANDALQKTTEGTLALWQKSETNDQSTTVPWTIRPSMRNAAVLDFTASQLYQITGGYGRREAFYQANNWTYEMRRDAQQILPQLYLGPTNAARDRLFLRRAGITKVMAIRDSRLAEARLLVVEHVAKELGIESECIDVADSGALLRALTFAVQSINRHMLAMPTNTEGVSTGKVLVYCETGNVRSPPVVAAYLMSMYGMELLEALQFVHETRFCVSLDEEYKRMLLSFSDLLKARCDVAGEDGLMWDAASGPVDNAGAGKCVGGMREVAPRGRADVQLGLLAVPQHRGVSRSCSRPPKRHVEETVDEEDDRVEAAGGHTPSREPSAEPSWLNLDMARYQDRVQFVPFTDNSTE
ncbi:hypothetical protein SEPCBS57363_000026 [Sporothrix epigloea]|uniref:Tyrosine specific protein phosphatases domain-containing protein n=1 Tax=Sporothrix epigloea TaxID=1892477 RepID=A0ABP0D3H6_9PEZI